MYYISAIFLIIPLSLTNDVDDDLLSIVIVMHVISVDNVE